MSDSHSYSLYIYLITNVKDFLFYSLNSVNSDQGNNARKVISEVYASFVQHCTVSMGGNVNTRQMSQPCHSLTWDPSLTQKINEIFWSQETIM